MKYVWGYLVFVGLDSIIACVVYKWLPTYRPYLVEEDSLIENLSAGFYLLSCFLALLFLKIRKGHKRLLIFISVLGLVGFLDEISFGERIFEFPMPQIGDVSIDAAHDFLDLAYRRYFDRYFYALMGIGVVLLVVLVFISARYWSRLMNAVPGLVRQPYYVLLLFSVVSVLTALIIDLEMIDYKPLFMLEELLEMNAAIALLFCCLSLLGTKHNPTGVPQRSIPAG